MFLLRTCPNCKQKCIDPLKFHKGENYQCPNCHYYISVPIIFSLISFLIIGSPWIVELFGYEMVLFKMFPKFSYFTMLAAFTYWAIGHKTDAMIFPLDAQDYIDV